MHPVLERVRVLFHGVLRAEKRPSNSELRACRIIFDILPSEIRPMDEVVLIPMTFEQYVELLSLYAALDNAVTPAPKKGTARAATPTAS